jgi:hypothetical protein
VTGFLKEVFNESLIKTFFLLNKIEQELKSHTKLMGFLSDKFDPGLINSNDIFNQKSY